MVKIINFSLLSEAIKNEIKKETHGYLSSNQIWCLFTNEKEYTMLNNKYHIESYSIQEWLELVLEESSVEVFDREYELIDYIEPGLDTIEDLSVEYFENNNWDIAMINLVKIPITIKIGNDLEESLEDLKKQDFDMSIIKAVVNRVI